MYARIPAFLRASDAAAVILALLLVFAMVGGVPTHRADESVHPIVVKITDAQADVLRA